MSCDGERIFRVFSAVMAAGIKEQLSSVELSGILAGISQHLLSAPAEYSLDTLLDMHEAAKAAEQRAGN